MSKTPIRPAASTPDKFSLLMYQFMSAVERLKLATAKLKDLEGEEEALPQEYIPAAFVVEEATQALEQIHEDLYPLGPQQEPPDPPDALGTDRCTCPRCDGEGSDWCEPEEARASPAALRAA